MCYSVVYCAYPYAEAYTRMAQAVKGIFRDCPTTIWIEAPFVLNGEGLGPQIVGRFAVRGLGLGLAVGPHGQLTGPACGLIAGCAETVPVDDPGVRFSAFWASHGYQDSTGANRNPVQSEKIFSHITHCYIKHLQFSA